MVSESDGPSSSKTGGISSSMTHPLDMLGDTYGIFDLMMDTSSIKPILTEILCSSDHWRRNGRHPVVLSTFPFSAIAREINASCSEALFYEIANVERMIVGDSRHAMNLGDQLAFEIFSTVMMISDLDIFLLGASNLYLSDRRGFNRDLTDVFWSSFISSLLMRNDRNRLFILIKGGLKYVSDLLSEYIVARISMELSDQTIRIRLIYL
ncbi:hypothetical protein [Thermoplasma acidophilum]|nr:hypothetical protein [Thermoplasma acidophilum]MCY0852320.1 hypothetical protein [Thermoplasma acidophilum]